jgi:predicted glycoside hydrolase/deacetylase ChbG (UPF0249 family)
VQCDSLIFCADDWGMSPGINEGILELGRKKLLYSVSCMANLSYLVDGLYELLSYKKNGLKFNIHFNLTHGHSGFSHSDLPNLTTKSGHFLGMHFFFLKSHLGLISQVEYRKVFLHQLNILKKYEIPITGIDGHHHVHLIPSVYNSIKDLLVENNITDIRTMVDSQHLMSYLQSLYFKYFIYDQNDKVCQFPCGYLIAKNLIDVRKLKNKINRYKFLIVHPAKYDDFQFVELKDKLQTERLDELKLLLGYFS